MEDKQAKKELRFVFVHGLSGWGSYDEKYKRMPYWGMRGGDLMAFLREAGFDCRAASVSPRGSAWDRACELYAQIFGTRTDYGRAHSKKYRHERFGRDFSADPLFGSSSEGAKLVLLGHSFGGATVRLLSALMAEGDAQERADGAEDLSPLFRGGMEGQIHAIVTVASPMNGTTAYDLFEDPAFAPDRVKVPWWSRLPARWMSRSVTAEKDGRDERDYAAHDMHIDNAMAMNLRIPVLPKVYYFSVPCCFTRPGKKDARLRVPKRGMEPLFVMKSCQMGAYTGITKGGKVIDESWRDNDGLVNTLSASCPLGEPSMPLDRKHIRTGVWNVFPTHHGDHMSLQGGLMRRHDIRAFYRDLAGMIGSLE